MRICFDDAEPSCGRGMILDNRYRHAARGQQGGSAVQPSAVVQTTISSTSSGRGSSKGSVNATAISTSDDSRAVATTTATSTSIATVVSILNPDAAAVVTTLLPAPPTPDTAVPVITIPDTPSIAVAAIVTSAAPVLPPILAAITPLPTVAPVPAAPTDVLSALAPALAQMSTDTSAAFGIGQIPPGGIISQGQTVFPAEVVGTGTALTTLPPEAFFSIYSSYTAAASASLESDASSAAASIRSSLVANSQSELVTTLPNGMTTTFEVGSLIDPSPTDPPSPPFFQDKGAVAGVFSIVGVIAAAVVVMIVTALYRSRRARRLNAESDEALAVEDLEHLPRSHFFSPDFSEKEEPLHANGLDSNNILPFHVSQVHGNVFSRSSFPLVRESESNPAHSEMANHPPSVPTPTPQSQSSTPSQSSASSLHDQPLALTAQGRMDSVGMENARRILATPAAQQHLLTRATARRERNANLNTQLRFRGVSSHSLETSPTDGSGGKDTPPEMSRGPSSRSRYSDGIVTADERDPASSGSSPVGEHSDSDAPHSPVKNRHE